MTESKNVEEMSEEELWDFWKRIKLYRVLMIISALTAGGITWYIFRHQEEAILAVWLVVVATLMPYAWWQNSLDDGCSHPRWVRYLANAVIIFVLSWVLYFVVYALIITR